MVLGIVSRRDVAELLHPLQQRRVDAPHAGETPGEDRFEADRTNVGNISQTSAGRVRQPLDTPLQRRGVVGDGQACLGALSANRDRALAFRLTDAIDPAARELAFGRHVEQPKLEARRAQIGNQDLHIHPSLLA